MAIEFETLAQEESFVEIDVLEEQALLEENQKMPYNRAIPWGLHPESWVMLEGFIPQQSKGFHMNFVYGQYRGANVALSFSLRFEGPPPSSSAMVVLSSFADGQRGEEEKTRVPLQQGQRFKIQIIVTSKGYKIMGNDRLLCEFAHRLPPEPVRFLEMDGDVTLGKLVFNEERSSSSSRRVPRAVALPRSRWAL